MKKEKIDYIKNYVDMGHFRDPFEAICHSRILWPKMSDKD